MKKTENNYKKSGVNISLANKLVNHISLLSKKNVKKTKSNSFKQKIGGFGSLFDISITKSKILLSYLAQTELVLKLI